MSNKLLKRRATTSSISKNPKVLIFGLLPEESKLILLTLYENCQISIFNLKPLEQQPANGVRILRIPYSHNNEHITIDYWNFELDFQRYDRLASIYWENIDAVIGIFSLWSSFSFLKMKYWIERYIAQNIHEIRPIYILAYEQIFQFNNPEISEEVLNDYARLMPNYIQTFIIPSSPGYLGLRPFFKVFFNHIQRQLQQKRLRLKN